MGQRDQRIDITVPPASNGPSGSGDGDGAGYGCSKRISGRAKAGLRNGDLLLTINGEEVDDPLTLPQQLAALKGEPVELEFQRPGAATMTVSIDSLAEENYHPYMGPGATIGLQSIGIAYQVGSVVTRVRDESPAAAQGLAAGDEVILVRFNYEPDQDGLKAAQGRLAAAGTDSERTVAQEEIDQAQSRVDEDQQTFDAFFAGRLGYARTLGSRGHATDLARCSPYPADRDAGDNGESQCSTCWSSLKRLPSTRVDSTEWFFPLRGLIFMGLERTNRSKSWTSAVALGLPGDNRESCSRGRPKF